MKPRTSHSPVVWLVVNQWFEKGIVTTLKRNSGDESSVYLLALATYIDRRKNNACKRQPHWWYIVSIWIGPWSGSWSWTKQKQHRLLCTYVISTYYVVVETIQLLLNVAPGIPCHIFPFHWTGQFEVDTRTWSGSVDYYWWYTCTSIASCMWVALNRCRCLCTHKQCSPV